MISVVTPTYNEKENILRFIKEVSHFLKGKKEPFEIIIVDDNSPDGTAELVNSVKSKYPNISLIRRAGKRGLGSAYFDGYSAAKGDILIGIDADLSPSLSSISSYIKNIENGDDMVIGSRYLPKSEIYGQSMLKLGGSKLFNILAGLFLSIPYSDITHSYRAITKKAFDDIRKKITEVDHPSFFIEFSFWVNKKGYRVSEIPIVFKERRIGYSKLNFYQGLKSAIKTVVRLKKMQ